jgi:transcriptional regulator with XRE-family HTH domain
MKFQDTIGGRREGKNMPEDFRPNSGRRLRRLRESRKMTLEQAASIMGVAKSTVSSWETGEFSLHVEWAKHREAIERLSKALGLPEGAFWDLERDMSGGLRRTFPYGGSVPCDESEYLGVLAGSPSKMRTNAHLLVDEQTAEVVAEVFDVVGSSMSGRIEHGAKIAVKAAKSPVHGLLHLVLEEGLLAVYGAFLSEGGWRVAASRMEASPLKGRVLGRVVAIEHLWSGTRFLETNPDGLPYFDPRFSANPGKPELRPGPERQDR